MVEELPEIADMGLDPIKVLSAGAGMRRRRQPRPAPAHLGQDSAQAPTNTSA
jgi:hypothetical protein